MRHILIHLIGVVNHCRFPMYQGYPEIDKHLNEIFHEIATEKGFSIKSMEMMPDHVHLTNKYYIRYTELIN